MNELKPMKDTLKKVTAARGYFLGGEAFGISYDPWHDVKLDPPEREDGYLVYMEGENPGYLLAMWDPETKTWYYYMPKILAYPDCQIETRDVYKEIRIELEDQEAVRYWMDIPLIGDTTKTIVEWCRKEEEDI